MQDEIEMPQPGEKILEADETQDLISSEKVDGTPVFNPAGERLGKIHHFMVGKQDGKVHYAIMSFGGFLGIGSHRYPLPWDALDYEAEQGGYVVDIGEEQLDSALAPSYPEGEEPEWNGKWQAEIRRYYLPTF